MEKERALTQFEHEPAIFPGHLEVAEVEDDQASSMVSTEPASSLSVTLESMSPLIDTIVRTTVSEPTMLPDLHSPTSPTQIARLAHDHDIVELERHIG